MLDKINWRGYPPYKQSVYDSEELTALELAGRTTYLVNAIVDEVNGIPETVRRRIIEEYESGLLVKDGVKLQSKPLIVNVPSDFPSIQQAIDLLSERHKKQGIQIHINIEQGHSISSGFNVRDGDYSHFKVVAEDEIVKVVNFNPNEGDNALFYCYNARPPILSCLVDMQGEGNSETRGYYIRHGSTGYIEEYSGVINCAGHNLNVQSSLLFAYRTRWNGGQGDNEGTCIRLQQAAVAALQGAHANNGGGPSSVYVGRGSLLHYQYSQATNANGNAIVVRRARANLEEADVSGAGQYGVYAERGSLVNAQYVIAQDCSRSFVSDTGSVLNANGGDARGSSVRGVYANRGGYVNATNIQVGGSSQLISAENGSRINANGATNDGQGASQYNVYADMGSFVSVCDSNLTNAGQRGLFASGGEIVATNSILTGAGQAGVRVTGGGKANISGSNVRTDVSNDNSNDIYPIKGIVIAYDTTGGNQFTPNEFNPNGIIIRN